MLPDMDGLDICRKLRLDSQTPVLMLTARGDAMDRVVGLEIGADDYLPKPFEPRELLARVESASCGAATGGQKSDVLHFGRLDIDIGARQATLDGEPCDADQLSVRTAAGCWRSTPGRVMSRDAIMDALKNEQPGSVRPLDRRAYLAHPRRNRGRSEKSAARHHRAWRGLCVRQGARLNAHAPPLSEKSISRSSPRCLLVVLIAGAFWRMGANNAPVDAGFDMVGEMAMAVLPPADAPLPCQQQTIEHFAQRIDADLALFDRDFNPIASVGRPIGRPQRGDGIGWMPGPAGPIWHISACRTSAGCWCARIFRAVIRRSALFCSSA